MVHQEKSFVNLNRHSCSGLPSIEEKRLARLKITLTALNGNHCLERPINSIQERHR
jgi:hypothetical protein